MIYGYARVSTKEQKNGYGLEVQEKEILTKYPNIEVYKEAFTGTKLHRPVFDKLIDKLQEGDVLVVSKLDRFARNTVEGLNTIKKLLNKKVSIHMLNFGLVEDNPMGKFLITIMLATAELERNMIVERTQSGKKIAIEKGNLQAIGGRPKKHTESDLLTAINLLKTHTYREVIAITGISKSTLVRARKNM